MSYQRIPLAQLHVCASNVRKPDAVKGIDELKASIRSVGLLNPITVRADAEGYAIIAGQRRWMALKELAEEEQALSEHELQTQVPCIVISDVLDDGYSQEVSLAENVHRQELDPVDEALAFKALAEGDASPADIAARFGKPERYVRQRLALATLDDKVLAAVKAGECGLGTAQLMTMVGRKRQKEALKAIKAGELRYLNQVRHFLFGQTIPTSVAIFPVEQAKVVADLFGEESHFADEDEFWKLQRAAFEARAEALRAEGKTVIVNTPEAREGNVWQFQARKGGKVVVIELKHDGSVTEHADLAAPPKSKKAEQDEQADLPEAEASAPPKGPAAEVTKGLAAELNCARLLSAQAALMISPRLCKVVACVMLLNRTSSVQVRETTIPFEIGEAHARTDVWNDNRRCAHHLLGTEEGSALHGHLPASVLFERIVALNDASLDDLFGALVARLLEDERRDSPHQNQLPDLVLDQLDVKPGDDYAFTPAHVEAIRNKAALLAMLEEIGAPGDPKARSKELKARLVAAMKATPEWRPRWLNVMWQSYLDPVEPVGDKVDATMSETD